MHLRHSYWHRFPKLIGLLGLVAIAGCQGADSNPSGSNPSGSNPSGSNPSDGSQNSTITAEAGKSGAVATSVSVAVEQASPESERQPTETLEIAVVETDEVDESAETDVGGVVATESDAVDEAHVAEIVVSNATSPAPDNSSASEALPAEANVATAAERNQTLATDWPMPQAVLFVSGQQHGYIEPCGCTGLENQKGGLIRRDTLLKELRERGWEIIPVDVGNQVRRIGRQPELKFQTTVEAFKTMGYRAVALGIDDLKLSSIELIQMAGSDGLNESPFLSANVSVIDKEFFPSHRIIEAGGRKIGITAVLGKEHEAELQSRDIQYFDAVEKLKPVVQQLEQEGCDFKVLLAHASVEESAELARQVPGFDLVVTAGGFGEPTLMPESIEGSQAVMVQVGTKGMYGGIVGIYADAQQPIRYQKIAISSQFKDSKRMLEEFALYQQRLADAGFDGLGLTFTAHPTGRTFVGSEACGECHSSAFEIWKKTPHFRATTSIIEPDNERGGIPRHHDPECISCHATGWNPQKYYPYETGFVSSEETPLMTGSGCENCHGPGSEHVAAELGEIDVTSERLKELQQQMVLPLDKARDKCLECHDLDNSPDFHLEGAFDKYWEQVKHHGMD